MRLASVCGPMMCLGFAVVANVGIVLAKQVPTVLTKDLKRHVGKEVVACGRAVTYDCDDARGALRLFLDNVNGSALLVVPREYWPDSRGRSVTDRVLGAAICARGTVHKEKGAYAVMVNPVDPIDVREPAPAAAVPFAPEALHTCAEGVIPPRLRTEVKPNYTRQAMRAKYEGKMHLEAEVLEDGTVGDVRELTTLEYGLGPQAISALKQWRFEPARLAGRTVRVVVTVEMTFTLK